MKPEEVIEALRLEGGIDITGKPKRIAEFFEGLDMAIEALKEVYQYREMDRKLRVAYGDCDGLLEVAINGLCKHSGIDIENPIKARLLTDEDVDKWENYLKIGTVEECRKAVEKQKPEKPEIYTDTIQTISSSFNRDVYLCSRCGQFIGNIDDELPRYCNCCGQRIDDDLEGMENE